MPLRVQKIYRKNENKIKNTTEINMTTTKTGIYFGNRGDSFKRLITSLLKRAINSQKYIDILTDDRSMEVFSAAFTSEEIDEANNYQVYEQLGDLTGNKFIGWYSYRRFPQLKCSEGVQIVARLKINYGAKRSFFSIAQKLGFWEFISAPNELRARRMKPLLEDVFEAFLGATESLIDDRIKFGVGYSVVYRILESIFNEIPISLKYEDLYDAKTRLKELFDLYGKDLGPLLYEDEKQEIGNDNQITYSTVYRVQGGQYFTKPNGKLNRNRIIGGTKIKLGVGSAALQDDAQQKAAEKALWVLKQQGWEKELPEVYKKFERQKNGIKKNITWSGDINDLQKIKRTKYQTFYECTILGVYCRNRDVKAVKYLLKKGANPDIPDNNGVRPIELLLIGKKEEEKIETILKLLIKHYRTPIRINKDIYQIYFRKYKSMYFAKIDKIIHRD